MSTSSQTQTVPHGSDQEEASIIFINIMASSLRKMLVISPEQLERLKGETMKEMKTQLESEMKEKLKKSDSVEKQDVEGMYREWDEYRSLLGKYLDVKRRERTENVNIPIFEVAKAGDTLPHPLLQAAHTAAFSEPVVEVKQEVKKEQSNNNVFVPKGSRESPRPRESPRESLNAAAGSSPDADHHYLRGVPVLPHRIFPEFDYDRDSIPRMEYDPNNVSLEDMLDMISDHVNSGAQVMYEEGEEEGGDGGLFNTPPVAESQFLPRFQSSPITHSQPTNSVAGSPTLTRGSPPVDQSRIRQLRHRDVRWTPLQLLPRRRHQ